MAVAIAAIGSRNKTGVAFRILPALAGRADKLAALYDYCTIGANFR
jgi:hypothetical protein